VATLNHRNEEIEQNDVHEVDSHHKLHPHQGQDNFLFGCVIYIGNGERPPLELFGFTKEDEGRIDITYAGSQEDNDQSEVLWNSGVLYFLKLDSHSHCENGLEVDPQQQEDYERNGIQDALM
jgi:hypothetical protein